MLPKLVVEEIVGCKKQCVSIVVPKFGKKFLLWIHWLFFDHIDENLFVSERLLKNDLQCANEIEVLTFQKDKVISFSKFKKFDCKLTVPKLFNEVD